MLTELAKVALFHPVVLCDLLHHGHCRCCPGYAWPNSPYCTYSARPSETGMPASCGNSAEVPFLCFVDGLTMPLWWCTASALDRVCTKIRRCGVALTRNSQCPKVKASVKRIHMEVLMEEIWRNTRQQKQKSIAFPNCREREWACLYCVWAPPWYQHSDENVETHSNVFWHT